MRTIRRLGSAVGLVVLGYIVGASGVFAPLRVLGQEPVSSVPKETADKIRSAHSGLSIALSTLQQDKLYNPAMNGINAFVVLAGGADVRQDLETGRGVDPETFAALYADRATDEVKKDLDRDEDGRLTYKGKVVRMYPISRLKQMFEERDRIAGLAEN